MSISLYEATARTFIQMTQAAEGVLALGREHFGAQGMDLEEALQFRLIDDMMPLRFQISAIPFFSLKAIEATIAGEFSPSPGPNRDFDELQALLAESRSDLEAMDPADVESCVRREVVFKIRSYTETFRGQDFLLSFAIPNFFFHVTTMYDILRWKGVAIGKANFLGPLRTKAVETSAEPTDG